ncbi:MAG: PEGA domain-containing protein [Myxococcaceae bacterium]|nr:PEGA domain-containing protein [Myxococcaceae bacterium]
MTPYNEEETLLINKRQEKPYDEDQTLLINKKRPKDTRWIWGLLAGCTVLVLGGVGASFWPRAAPVGPPPPAPVSLPQREVRAPPPAPLVSPIEEMNQTAPPELLAREQAIKYEERQVDARPPPPKLRKNDPGIAPQRITRKVSKRSARRGSTNFNLVAMFHGKPISAPVEVNGVWRGNTPLAVKLDPGSHAIRIDHDGTRVNEFVTSVTEGQNVRLKVDLRPASEAEGSGPSKRGKRHGR